MSSHDVIIVGAGTAGAGAAWQCASRGLRVLCLDARPLDAAGARWVNGVARWQLDAAGIPQPAPAPGVGHEGELRGGHGEFHLVAGWGPRRVQLPARDMLELDMRKLVARLQDMATAAGAELRGDVRVHGLAGDSLATSAGSFRAEVVVDASGLAGARLGAPWTPRPGPEHICAAAQAVHALTDSEAAQAYFAAHDAEPGDTLCFTGIAGGYSILNVTLEGSSVSLLTGSIPAAGHPSGRALLDAFVAEQPWIGAERFGGARAIPIRRPFDRLVHGRLALLGDAASQVFSAHGSGIGIGLIAGRVLAEALVGPGLASYEARFLREQGGLLAAYDIFRRYSQTLRVADLEALMAAGSIDAASSGAAMLQRWPSVALRALPAKLAGLLRDPARAAALASVGARMAEVAALYRAYPGADHPLARSWSRVVAQIVGDAPDLG